MAVPKRKTSPSRRGMRNAHASISILNLAAKSPSGDFGLSHVAIKTNEGLFYKGRLVLKKKQRKEKSQEN